MVERRILTMLLAFGVGVWVGCNNVVCHGECSVECPGSGDCAVTCVDDVEGACTECDRGHACGPC